MSSPLFTTATESGGAISTVHSDIIQTHILTKTDGPTLASAACASSLLYALCTEEKLWTNICNSKWPSTNQSLLSDVISTFPAGHRSFFADAFAAVDWTRRPAVAGSPVTKLISAVDIFYDDIRVFSKVEVTETETEWFRCSPFRIDLLEPKEPVSTPVKFENKDVKFQTELGRGMSMSWVLIDPIIKRAVNLSSRRPVSVQRHWLTGDIQVQFATVMPGDRLCSVVVTCGGNDLHVREVSLHVQDIEGKCLSGRDSLVILQEAMESGRKKNGNGDGNGTEEKERYEEYVEKKRESRDRKQRREKMLDLLCMATGLTIFMVFWGFILL